MTPPPVFPFSALLGQTRMKLALLLNAVDPRIGGVLIRGEKGSAKSTAVRGFARLLPEIPVVSGCSYSCDPMGEVFCGDCEIRLAAAPPLPTALRPTRVVDLPIGATEDRVIGTLNLERALQAGERAFEPGLLAAAHRGILYVDEVNLLGDHLVDVLLDAAAMGRNYVEREGVSISHAANFILAGTMNPEEGDLRPQLLDRFGLAVEVERMTAPADRAEVVRRRIAFERDPAAFARQWADSEQALRTRLERAQALLPSVMVAEALLEHIGEICSAYGVDGLRGDIVVYKTSVALAAYHGRTQVEMDDVREAARLALLHRRRRDPFDQPESAEQELENTLDRLDSQTPSDHGTDGAPTLEAADQVFAPGPPPALRPLATEPARPWPLRAPSPPGRRAGGQIENRMGRYTRSQPASGPLTYGSLALDATVRAAAPFQIRRRSTGEGRAGIVIEPGDLQEKIKVAPHANLVLFLVDASGSMAAQRRMSAVKGAVLALLRDVYRRRDRVGLITFRGSGAQQALAPTGSVELAERRLRVLPTGGKTPLADALRLAHEVIARERRVAQRWEPLLVLITDGRANLSRSGDPLEQARRTAAGLRGALVRSVVIDTETGPVRLGLARMVAEALGARHQRLDDLTAQGLASAVRLTIEGVRPFRPGGER
ncbi:MAG: VWA domain-containing protein [Dehalococcoidia bacterium]|nr:VWA domain-containing protein [Dehalococcoidia bacterium]